MHSTVLTNDDSAANRMPTDIPFIIATEFA
jgi:hypothetical protein